MAMQPPSKRLKVKHELPHSSHFFDGFHVYIVEQGVGKVRCNILKQQVESHKGHIQKEYNSSTTHVFISKALKKERLLKILKRNQLEGALVLFVDWLSACLVKGELVATDNFIAYQDLVLDHHLGASDEEDCGRNNVKASTTKKDNEYHIEAKEMGVKESNEGEGTSVSSIKPDFSDEIKMGKENDAESEDEARPSETRTNPNKSFVYSRPSTSQGENFNKHITDKLQMLQDEYTSTQDRWRAFGYKKAIASIAKYHKPLESYEEVLNLPAVGERLAKKVWEIIETGHLQRLDHIDPKVEVIKLFSGVWGAGPKTAEQWMARGFKSLSDLPESELTFQQKIGVKHYHDINEKMPRSEVAEIEKLIRKYAEDLLPGVLLVICGSYRRGRAYCGDIDILLSHADGDLHKEFLSSLLNKLKEVKVITDDLITVDNEAQRKYMGMCKLPCEGSKYRRIDFIAAPYCEWPCALLHFTGSAHFNRSIRLLAKKKNMSLSEHSLRKDVVRGKSGVKVNKGQIVPISSEADVFKYLELDYLEPTERDW